MTEAIALLVGAALGGLVGYGMGRYPKRPPVVKLPTDVVLKVLRQQEWDRRETDREYRRSRRVAWQRAEDLMGGTYH